VGIISQLRWDAKIIGIGQRADLAGAYDLGMIDEPQKYAHWYVEMNKEYDYG
jgi:hypothetical protein